MQDFLMRLNRILDTDKRYKEEPYLFVMAALNRAVGSLPAPRHVTGAELLEAIRLEAIAQFGPMARTVLEHWGIKNSLDFGHIVFNMVREAILSKTDSDTLDGFEDELFFERLSETEQDYRLLES